MMKSFLTLVCASALSVGVAAGQTSPGPTTTTTTQETQTSTAATENAGTISEFNPGATIVLNTGTGEPAHYKLGKSVTYMNAKGKVINADRVRKGRKVRVHYVKEGNDMVVDKVTVIKKKE